MKLNKHSWHAKLNSFVYGKYYVEDQRNFCPYFWGTIAAFPLSVIMGIILGFTKIPFSKIQMPEICLSHKTQRNISYGLLSIPIGVLGFIIFHFVMLGYGIVILEFAGCVGGVIGGGFGLIKLIEFLAERIGDYLYSHPRPQKEKKPKKEKPVKVQVEKPYVPKPYKPKQPNIFIEAIKSYKEKHCPRIEWDE